VCNELLESLFGILMRLFLLPVAIVWNNYVTISIIPKLHVGDDRGPLTLALSDLERHPSVTGSGN